MWKMTTYKITYLHELAINVVRWQFRRHHEKGLGVDNDFFQFNQNCYGYINVAFLYGGHGLLVNGENLKALDWRTFIRIHRGAGGPMATGERAKLGKYV